MRSVPALPAAGRRHGRVDVEMRIELVIQVRLGDEEQRRLADEGQLSITDAQMRHGFVEYRLAAHSREAEELVARLQAAGAEFSVHEERHFTLKEIRTAPALHVEPATAKKSEPVEIEAAHYDWTSVCPRCMRVPQPEGSLTFKRGATLGEALLRGKRGELIVNERVAVRMIKDGITGCLLREVKCEGDSAASSYFQIVPTSVLPEAISPPTRFTVSGGVCAACGRGGLSLESMLYYDVPLGRLEDVNVTRELFGDGPALAPEIVVSQRFYNLLLATGARLSGSEPVLFV
jgi:hypothetical protein